MREEGDASFPGGYGVHGGGISAEKGELGMCLTLEEAYGSVKVLLKRACDGDFWNPTYREAITVGHAESIAEIERMLENEKAPARA
jgi:hypothetical protein